MKRFLSLNQQNFTIRIFSYLMMTVGACVFIQMAIHLYISDKNMREQILQEGHSFLRIYIQAARQAIYAEDQTALARVSEALLRHGEISTLFVFDTNMRVLYQATQGKPNKKQELSIAQELLGIDINHHENDVFPFKETPNEFQFITPVFTTPISENLEDPYFPPKAFIADEAPNGEKIGYIYLEFDKKRLTSNQNTALKTVLMVAVLVILFSGVVTYFISRTAAAPLHRIIKEIQKKNPITQEEDELKILSGAFESMLKSLEEAFNTITELKDNLEIRVQERTADLARANEELKLRQEELAASNRRLEETLAKLKNTQAQLVHSEKMVAMGQLVAGVAHEINNTTNFISGALPPLFILLEKVKAKFPVQEARDRDELPNFFNGMETLLGNIREGVKRNIRIVQDLRTFSRSSSEDDICLFNIHQGLNSTLNLMHNEIKYRARVVRDFGEDLPRICCNPSQLNQVFMNILLNAVQALPENEMGTITVKTRLEGEYVHVIINDTGKGIPDTVLPQIFNPFFTTKPIGKGTGLGLSIAYSIIEKHRGQILVESEEGKGSTFVLVLPVERNNT